MCAKKSIYNEFSLLVEQIIRKLNLLNRDQKYCYGLTIPQCYTVESLARKGMLTMNELSKDVGVTISTMTRIIDILTRDGIVDRKRNQKDRRQVCVKLSKKGRDIALKLKHCSEKYSEEMLNQVPIKERKNVFKSLKILNSAIEKISKKCCG